jgi:urease accessory protein
VALSPSGAATLGTLAYSYPLKLVSPSPSAQSKCVIVFLLTYGGGLVSGDGTRLNVSIAASSRLALLTQGSTKIFKALRRAVTTRQELSVTVEGDGALVYLPDPVQPFGESVYEQRQVFTLDPQSGGSLCVLDWLHEGRTARGEKWDFWSWKGQIEVWSLSLSSSGTAADSASSGKRRRRRLLLRDNLTLEQETEEEDSADAGGSLRQKMHGLGVFGTAIFCGRLFVSLGKFFLQEFSCMPRIGAPDLPHLMAEPIETTDSFSRWRARRQERESSDSVLWTASAVRGCVVVKFGAIDVEGARRWLGDMIRQEGSVEKNFGEEALLCLR